MRKTTLLSFPLGLFSHATWSGPLAAELNGILATGTDIDAARLSEIKLCEADVPSQVIDFPKPIVEPRPRQKPPEAELFASRSG